MRRRFAIFSVIGATLAALAVGGVGVFSASAQEGGNQPITLCHATNSETNPYEVITVDADAIFDDPNVVPNGHGTHTGPIFPDTAPGPGNSTHWGDIIPPFDNYPGLNATTQGLAILENGCKIPGPPETTAPPETKAPPVTTAPRAPQAPQAPQAPAPAAVVGAPRVTG